MEGTFAWRICEPKRSICRVLRITPTHHKYFNQYFAITGDLQLALFEQVCAHANPVTVLYVLCEPGPTGITTLCWLAWVLLSERNVP